MASGGGACSRGGGSKKKSKGGKGPKIIKEGEKLRSTATGYVHTMRQAIFDEMGYDKDVTADFRDGPLLSYKYKDANGEEVDARIEFYAGGKGARTHRMPRQLRTWMFGLTKRQMEAIYDVRDAQGKLDGYGWDDDEKRSQLFDQASRMLIVTIPKKKEAEDAAAKEDAAAGAAPIASPDKAAGAGASAGGPPSPSAGGGGGADAKAKAKELEERIPVAFACFRFTLQGEVFDTMKGHPTLFVWDMQVEDDHQRRGIGRRLLMLLQLIAAKQKMSFVQTLVPKGCVMGHNFFSKKLKGFVEGGTSLLSIEEAADALEEECFALFEKCLDNKLKASKREKENVQAFALKLAQQINGMKAGGAAAAPGILGAAAPAPAAATTN